MSHLLAVTVFFNSLFQLVYGVSQCYLISCSHNVIAIIRFDEHGSDIYCYSKSVCLSDVHLSHS